MITEFKISPVEYLFEVEIQPIGAPSPMRLILSDVELRRLKDEITEAFENKNTIKPCRLKK